MDLNLKNKRVILSIDTAELCNQIKAVLSIEGATTILKKNRDTYDRICCKGLKVCSLVNVIENGCTKDYQAFVQSLYHADLLTPDFTIINIGTQDFLGAKAGGDMKDVLSIDHVYESLEQDFNVKNISIVVPECEKKLSRKGFLKEVGEKIADTVGFVVSGKSNLNNGQIIFLDKGAHLNTKFNNNLIIS